MKLNDMHANLTSDEFADI